MMTIKEKIETYNKKHTFIPREKNPDWGPHAAIKMYGGKERAKNGRTVYTTRYKYIGSWNYGFGANRDFAQNAKLVDCIYGIMTDVDQYVGLARMYEIKANIPDFRGVSDIADAYYRSTPYWEKAEFELYIDITTNKMYDKNGNTVRKSDNIFPCIVTKMNQNRKILSMHRKMAQFKEMNQMYFNDIENVRDKLKSLGYSTQSWQSDSGRFKQMIEYFMKSPEMSRFYKDDRTEIQKRNSFCESWNDANPGEPKKNKIYKIPEQYNKKNVYQIVFNQRSYKSTILYIVGKEYCVFTPHYYRSRGNIEDIPCDDTVAASELSVFKDDPNIGWVSKMATEKESVSVTELVKSISNIFYEQLTKMNMLGLLKAHFLLHGNNRRKTGNVLKYYGITKKQAGALNTYFSNCFINKDVVKNIFDAINGFFGFPENLSNEKEFEKVFADMQRCYFGSWSWGQICKVFSTEQTGLTKVERTIIMDQKKKILKICSENNRAPFYDMAEMYMRDMIYTTTGRLRYYLDDNDKFSKSLWLEITPDIHSPQDIQRKHDFYMAKCEENQKEMERKKDEEKQRQMAVYEEKNKKRQKKWEFSDDKFSVIFPMKISDVRYEGEQLHHCVGGYAERHITNGTTILFLRRNDKMDTPFYTIEICSNLGSNERVIQIHGSHNKWVGNDPDAAVFLYRYFKSHNVECDKIILLCTSSGCFSSEENKLDESILTDED